MLSRSCDEQSNGTAGCTKFQTRSGMSEAGCHAGVPCASRLPHTLPDPPCKGQGCTWAQAQNSYPIANAAACGHTPSAPVPASDHGPSFAHSTRPHCSLLRQTFGELRLQAILCPRGSRTPSAKQRSASFLEEREEQYEQQHMPLCMPAGRAAFAHASAVWKTMLAADERATWVYQVRARHVLPRLFAALPCRACPRSSLWVCTASCVHALGGTGVRLSTAP